MSAEADPESPLTATPEQEAAWGAMAKQMGYHDFHRLDGCGNDGCPGVCDCWTKHYTAEERKADGLTYHYRSEWICAKCGDVTVEVFDEQMQPIR